MHVNTPTLRSHVQKVFGVQLYKNNVRPGRPLLFCILSILNSDWLQHACCVRGEYEVVLLFSFVAFFLICHFLPHLSYSNSVNPILSYSVLFWTTFKLFCLNFDPSFPLLTCACLLHSLVSSGISEHILLTLKGCSLILTTPFMA